MTCRAWSWVQVMAASMLSARRAFSASSKVPRRIASKSSYGLNLSWKETASNCPEKAASACFSRASEGCLTPDVAEWLHRLHRGARQFVRPLAPDGPANPGPRSCRVRALQRFFDLTHRGKGGIDMHAVRRFDQSCVRRAYRNARSCLPSSSPLTVAVAVDRHRSLFATVVQIFVARAKAVRFPAAPRRLPASRARGMPMGPSARLARHRPARS